MPRATNSPASRARRKRVLHRAKGFRGFRSKLFRYAKDAVRKAMTYEYRDRKKRKGQFRRLWIQRISAAVRNEGLTYSRFIEGLAAAGIEAGAAANLFLFKLPEQENDPLNVIATILQGETVYGSSRQSEH